MKQFLSMITISVVAALTIPAARGYTTSNSGAGTLYRLAATQDVAIESPYGNHNGLSYLMVSKHPDYPNKRSLVQFEDLPSACPSSKVKFAKMYLYFAYAHKPSWRSVRRTPYIPRHLQVHLVKKAWHEAQATSTKATNVLKWDAEYLALDGRDAEASSQCGTVTMFPYRPGGFVEFDVTDAVKSWANGVANNGLLIRATNELDAGRGIRFFSKASQDARRHPFLNVLCA